MSSARKRAQRREPRRARARCLNCGALLEGRFCAACGQPAATARLGVRDTLRHAVEGFTAVERALPATLVGLTRDPGGLVAAYAGGRRASYVAPMKYAAWIVGIYVIAVRTFDVGGVTIRTFGDDADLAEKHESLVAAVRGMLDVAILLSLPIVAALQRGLFRRSGRNYAEGLAFLLFLTGHVYLLSLATLPIAALDAELEKLIRAPLALAYLTWGAVRFFGDPLWLALPKVLVLALASILLLIALLLPSVMPALGAR